MPKARVNGIDVNYVEAGSGDPVLLIMGFGGDHLAWAFQTPVFAQKYRVIAFDNRGAGQSDVPDIPYTTRMMAEDAVGLLDHHPTTVQRYSGRTAYSTVNPQKPDAAHCAHHLLNWAIEQRHRIRRLLEGVD